MKCPDLTNTEREPEFRVFSTCCAGLLPSGCSEAPARRPEASPEPATSEEGALFPRPPQELSFFFFFKFIYLFIFGCVGSSFLCEGFLWLWRAGATLHRGAWASHCRGLSC